MFQSRADLVFQAKGLKISEKKKKKNQISIHIVLTNYQPRQIHKSLLVDAFIYQQRQKTKNTIVS